MTEKRNRKRKEGSISVGSIKLYPKYWVLRTELKAQCRPTYTRVLADVGLVIKKKKSPAYVGNKAVI